MKEEHDQKLQKMFQKKSVISCEFSRNDDDDDVCVKDENNIFIWNDKFLKKWSFFDESWHYEDCEIKNLFFFQVF